jgi:hypothetical protein
VELAYVAVPPEFTPATVPLMKYPTSVEATTYVAVVADEMIE